MKKFLWLYILISAGIFAQPIISTTRIDWENGQITLNLKTRIETENTILPEAKIKAKEQISSALPLAIRKSLQGFFINSNTTVEQFLLKNINTLQKFEKFTELKYRHKLFISEDMQYLNAEYSFPVFPHFATLFIQHTYNLNIQKSFLYTPSANFTGIVIYAAEPLPFYGTEENTELKLCLFPKILTENGKILYQIENVPPKKLQDQEPVHYIRSLEHEPFHIAGPNPLRIAATAIYGDNKTDIVIPEEYADIILSRQNNIDLLTNGKIVIICPPKELERSVSLEISVN